MSDPIELVREVRGALAAGEIAVHELTARHLGQRLGKTSSVLYHHWGSLDGFLFAVSQSGFEQLAEVLSARLSEGAALEDIAEVFVGFGLDQQALYHVMFERRYDWDALRASGAMARQMPGLSLWSALTAFFAGAGSTDAEGDARLLFAGIHGLVSLASSGRANVGDRSVSDRDAAIAAARKLARRLLPKALEKENP